MRNTSLTSCNDVSHSGYINVARIQAWLANREFYELHENKRRIRRSQVIRNMRQYGAKVSPLHAKRGAVTGTRMASGKKHRILEKLARIFCGEKLQIVPQDVFSLYDNTGRRMAVCATIELGVLLNLNNDLKKPSLYDQHWHMVMTERLRTIELL